MTDKSDILYVLATRSYFLEGPCGRVSHAIGFASGIAANGKSITVLSGKGSREFLEDSSDIKLSEIDVGSPLLWWVLIFIRTFFLSRSHRVVVVRWRPIMPFLLVFALLSNRKIWFEINSLTGIGSRLFFVRFFVRISIFLAAKLFHIIVVSEESRRQIQAVSTPLRNLLVMPNGFFVEGFESFSAKICDLSKPNVVYFGRRQNYYDWDMLYEVCRTLISEDKIAGLHIFGFSEENLFPWVNYYGEFDRSALLFHLKAIENPILVIHPSNTAVAKGGSPMKLFEYAALALPVVAGSILSEQAKEFSKFTFYKAGSQNSLATSLIDVANSYTSRLQASKNSRDVAVQNYSWKAVTRPWIEVAGLDSSASI